MVQSKENKSKNDIAGSPHGPRLNQSSYLICLPERSVPAMPDQGGNDSATIVFSASELRSHHNNPDSNGKTPRRP